jgi:polyhydroxyalkanoic acid synthase PhaR subunit
MSTANPAQEAFDLWRKSLEEGTQAWLRAMGQAGAPTAAPPPAFDFSQFWRPLLTQGMEAWQKAAAQGSLSPEFMQQWKTVFDQSIEAWSKALGQAMATEGFAQALGRYLDQTLAAQAPLKKAFEQYTDMALRTLGLPSRGQVVSLASQVVGLEERIEGLEDRLDELKGLLREAMRALADHEAAAERRATRPPSSPRAGRSKEGS